jgi:hypothetical protein
MDKSVVRRDLLASASLAYAVADSERSIELKRADAVRTQNPHQ